MVAELDDLDDEGRDDLLLEKLDYIAGQVVGIVTRCHYQHDQQSCRQVIERLLNDVGVDMDDGFEVLFQNVISRLEPYRHLGLHIDPPPPYDPNDFINQITWHRLMTNAYITFTAMNTL